MYNPPQFKEQDVQRLRAFVLANSFATVVSAADDVPVVSHLPLHIHEFEGRLHIAGHFAKANSHWHHLHGRPVIAVFNGPHAYVSPSNYENNTGIPTWNYVAVHASGIARVAHDRDTKLAMLHRMFAKYESQVRHDFEAQTEKFQEGQLSAIVAFEFAIDHFEGKFKLSQNRSVADQTTVAARLAESPHAATRATGEMMRSTRENRLPPTDCNA